MFQTFISRHNSNFFSDKLRSEERFSRNDETDLVCRLLLEKKKLYADAFAGEIEEFTGVSAPYEEPLEPELRLDPTARTPSGPAATMIHRLQQLILLPGLDA